MIIIQLIFPPLFPRITELQSRVLLVEQFDEALLKFSECSESTLSNLHSSSQVNIKNLQHSAAHVKVSRAHILLLCTRTLLFLLALKLGMHHYLILFKLSTSTCWYLVLIQVFHAVSYSYFKNVLINERSLLSVVIPQTAFRARVWSESGSWSQICIFPGSSSTRWQTAAVSWCSTSWKFLYRFYQMVCVDISRYCLSFCQLCWAEITVYFIFVSITHLEIFCVQIDSKVNIINAVRALTDYLGNRHIDS